MAEPTPEVEEEERQLGGSERGRAVNGAILALSRAARSFLLYDSTNEAIKSFLQDLRDKMDIALRQGGSVSLTVRPFELVLGSEVVYLERDRERSLAFRMFRDGVRKLNLEKGVEWEELLKLLEILSIRYTGVRQQEDDIVTLLWKAGFKHISIEAVEGFVPEDDEKAAEGTKGPSEETQRARRGHAIEAPRDFDQPLPDLSAAAALVYRPLQEARLEQLRQEESSQSLAESCLRLVVEMVEVVAEPTDPTEIDDILPMMEEVREFLLSEGQLHSLVDLVRHLQAAFATRPDIVAPILARFADQHALKRILHSVPKTATAPPPELLELLDLIPANHLANIVDVLGMERQEAARRVARQLIERYAPRHADWLMEKIRSSDPAVARDLLRACWNAIPDRALAMAGEMARSGNPDVQIEALYIFEHAPPNAPVGDYLIDLLDAPMEDLRVRASDEIVKRREKKAFARMLEKVQKGNVSNRECEVFGRAMSKLDPGQAQALFSEWIKPANLLKRWFAEVPGQKTLRWTAVAGMELIPGDDVEDLLRWLSKQAGQDLYQHCMATIVRRRKTLGVPNG